MAFSQHLANVGVPNQEGPESLASQSGDSAPGTQMALQGTHVGTHMAAYSPAGSRDSKYTLLAPVK